MDRNIPETLNIEDYITERNVKYINALKDKNIEVKLFCPNGYDGSWMLGISNDMYLNEKGIVAPLSDYKNVELFTHELLHLYLDHYKGMYISAIDQFRFGKEFTDFMQDPSIFQPAMCNLIHNLQHHKMLPLYLDCGFTQEKFISNYHELVEPNEELFLVNAELMKEKSYRILFALEYGLTICQLLFETNPKNKEILKLKHIESVKALNLQLFNKFHSNLIKWENEDCDLRDLVVEFVQIIKDFTFAKI